MISQVSHSMSHLLKKYQFYFKERQKADKRKLVKDLRTDYPDQKTAQVWLILLRGIEWVGICVGSNFMEGIFIT